MWGVASRNRRGPQGGTISRKERIEIVPLIAVAFAVLTAGRPAGGITLPFGRAGWPVAAFVMFISTVTLAVLD